MKSNVRLILTYGFFHHDPIISTLNFTKTAISRHLWIYADVPQVFPERTGGGSFEKLATLSNVELWRRQELSWSCVLVSTKDALLGYLGKWGQKNTPFRHTRLASFFSRTFLGRLYLASSQEQHSAFWIFVIVYLTAISLFVSPGAFFGYFSSISVYPSLFRHHEIISCFLPRVFAVVLTGNMRSTVTEWSPLCSACCVKLKKRQVYARTHLSYLCHARVCCLWASLISSQ